MHDDIVKRSIEISTLGENTKEENSSFVCQYSKHHSD